MPERRRVIGLDQVAEFVHQHVLERFGRPSTSARSSAMLPSGASEPHCEDITFSRRRLGARGRVGRYLAASGRHRRGSGLRRTRAAGGAGWHRRPGSATARRRRAHRSPAARSGLPAIAAAAVRRAGQHAGFARLQRAGRPWPWYWRNCSASQSRCCSEALAHHQAGPRRQGQACATLVHAQLDPACPRIAHAQYLDLGILQAQANGVALHGGGRGRADQAAQQTAHAPSIARPPDDRRPMRCVFSQPC